jgi:uncharacterized protein YhfF
VLIPDALVPFWHLAAGAIGPDASARLYDISFFDDNEPSANHLAQLVVGGRKRATAGLAWSFEHDGRAPPEVGALSIVTNWKGEPMCVIETTSVSVVPFHHVNAQFAAAEGEGDGTLGYWRQVHWAYFARECARIGRAPTSAMPIVCEQFEVVYSGPYEPAA